MRTKLMYKLNRNLSVEENMVSVWKFWRRSHLKTRRNWQKFERLSPKKLTSESFDNDNKLTLKSFFAFCSVFFFPQGPTEERWKRLRERHNARFSKILQRYIKELKLTGLLVLTKYNFQHGEFVFTFLETLCCVLLFAWAHKNFFLDACQMIVKSRVLCLLPVPQTGRSHFNKHLVNLVFSVRTVNYGSSFFSIDLWPKIRKKNAVGSLQYGPKTRLIRCMYSWRHNIQLDLV